jgi:hypothetical protein
MKKNLVILISCCILVFLYKPAVAQVSIGISISARIAPPPLLVYEQPPCPVEGYLWCPGYWAYSDEGYFWVPGIWVLPPQYGYLWTPPYWGFDAGVYGFHPGYWGSHVGFYGGVNYGYGYWGSGFAGGRWEGNRFRYNTAVVHVNRTVVHNVYVDKTVIVNNYNNNRRISYNGGPGGVTVRPSSREIQAVRETHVQPTVDQTTHVQQARTNKAQFATVNHGHPTTVAMSRPGSHIEHEPGRTESVPATNNPSGNHNQPLAASHSVPNNAPNNAPNHIGATTHHTEKTNRPPTIPQHYVPLTQPAPVPREHPVPQHQRENSGQARPNNPNPQMQRPVPQQEHPQQEHPQHERPQQEHPQQEHINPQQHSAGQEPHNQPAHNPHEK